MALVNFKKESQDKLKVLIGEVKTEEQLRRLRFTDTFVEKNYYKVTHIIESTDGNGDPLTEYKAIQVNPDGTEVENGIVFDSDQTYTSDVDSPFYLPNLKINAELFSGSVEVGKAYKVEEVDPNEFNVEDPIYYIIPKGGGGGGFLYALVKSNVEDNIYNCDIYSEPVEDDSLKVEQDVLAVAYNVVYGEIPVGRFLPFTSGGNGGYITPSVWW